MTTAQEQQQQRQFDWEVAKAMSVWGGGFVQQLAKLWHMADEDNAKRIKETWKDYWWHYGDMVAQQRETNGPRWFDFGKL